MEMFGTKIQSLLSTDRICNLIKYSNYCASLPGYIAEFGCFRGGSLEILAKYNPGVNILGVDSFEGVPAASENDFHQEGDFGGIDSRAIIGYFSMVYPNVKIIKGFIPKVLEFFDEHTRFSFTHVDLDMYESIKHALDFIFPRTLDGGMILFDDYKVRSTPGCQVAIEEFFAVRPDVPYKFAGELKFWDAEDAPSHKQYLIVK